MWGGDLRTRFLSAIVLGPPVLVAAWVGGAALHVVVGVVALLAVREWVRLVEPGDGRNAFLLSALAVAVVVIVAGVFGAAIGLLAALAMTPLLFVAARLGHLVHCLWLAFAVPYIAVFCVALLWLRNENGDAGLWLLMFLLLTVWATDVGGYFAGRTIGGPKLLPSVSPKKTWAGLIGGMALAAAMGYGVARVGGAAWPEMAVPLAAGIAVAGQAGDLFESFMKRRGHVKDSGGLIPGHGGVLDRIDGLIFAAPFFAMVNGLLGGTLKWW